MLELESLPADVWRILQGIQALLIFILPGLLIMKLWKKPLVFDRVSSIERLRQCGFTALLMVGLIPAVNLTAHWNESMSLPESLKSLEDWMSSMEELAAQITDYMLKTTSVQDMLLNLLVIALLPAIGEELIFRGVLQNLTTKLTRSVHWGVWISAAVFSAVHFQFYGFVPRLILGAVLGYLYYWSGSLWIPVLAHFLNNAIAILGYFFETVTGSEFLNNCGVGPGGWRYVMVGAALAVVSVGWFMKYDEKRILNNHIL